VDKGWLELELTESVLMRDGDNIDQQIGALNEMGVGLVLDDFGTGCSSLSHLKRFPIRRIKIDRSFVSDIEHDAAGAALVRATVSIAQHTGIGLIAEGVETPGQLAMLRNFGCTEVQGFLTGHPVDADEIIRIMRDGSMGRHVQEYGIEPDRAAAVPSLKVVQ
jgi:EAL domain-containing protein (putative c-di-GMP-specific phosphodiesterase class I)